MTARKLFDGGKLGITPAALDKLNPDYAYAALERHFSGHWGLVDVHDHAANEQALRHGSRIMSVYPLPDEGGNFWIITEADRSATTILLPEEY